MSLGVSDVVADGVKVFDLLLILRPLILRSGVAEAKNVPRETHSIIYVTNKYGGSCKSRRKMKSVMMR